MIIGAMVLLAFLALTVVDFANRSLTQIPVLGEVPPFSFTRGRYEIIHTIFIRQVVPLDCPHYFHSRGVATTNIGGALNSVGGSTKYYPSWEPLICIGGEGEPQISIKCLILNHDI